MTNKTPDTYISIKDFIQKYSISLPDGESVPKKPVRRLIHFFHTVNDVRVQKKVEYPLYEILMAAFIAVLAGAATFVEIWDFCNSKRDWLEKYFSIKHGIPSHDTFRRVLSIIDPIHLQNATVAFLIENIRLIKKMFKITTAGPKQYCIDGKTACGTGRLKGTEHEIKQIHTLHVYDRYDGICIVSRVVGDKTNEIPVAQDILKFLDLRDSIVSFDSMHTQRDTIAAIIDKKGAYMAALKGNQPDLYEEVKSYFTPERLKRLELTGANFFEFKEKAHNKIEVRKYYLTKNVSWLVQAKDWVGLKSFVYYTIHTEDLNTGKTTDDVYVYITSLSNVALCADIIRGHWAVENLLHFHLDVNFYEDSVEIVDRVAFQNFSLLNKMALTLTKLIAPFLKKSVRLTRKHISWNEDAIVKAFCAIDEETLANTIVNVKI